MNGFPKQLLGALVCQKTGEPLILVSGGEESHTHVFQGVLRSTSGVEYHIKNGIVHMLDTGMLYGEGKDEIVSRAQEAPIYDTRLSSRFYKEAPSTLKALGSTKDKKVIDYGCGTGRITSQIHNAQAILAVDISFESLCIFAEKKHTNIGLVLADASIFITKKKYFDCALSSQVYEHIPLTGRRIQFLEHVRDSLKKNGVCVVTMYHHDIRRRLRKEKQEGNHAGGIFYHYFTHGEVQREFSQIFNAVNVIPIDITFPLEVRFGIRGAFGGVVSRVCEHIPVVRSLGHLLRVVSKT